MPTLAIVSGSLTSHSAINREGSVHVTFAGAEAGSEKQAYLGKFTSLDIPIKSCDRRALNMETSEKVIMEAMEGVLGFFATRGYVVVVGNTVNTMFTPGRSYQHEMMMTYTLRKADVTTCVAMPLQ